jgi:VanZ family protein
MTRARLVAWVPPVAYMGIIFAVSSIAIEVPLFTFPLRDKVVHTLEYGLLGLLIARAAFITWPDRATIRIVAFAALIATTFGVSDEIHQSFVPGRSAELLDAVADFVGASLGATTWALVRRRRAS